MAAGTSAASTVAVRLHEDCEIESLSRKLAQFGLTAAEPMKSVTMHYSGEASFQPAASAYVDVPEGYAQEWAEILSDIACVEDAWPTAGRNDHGQITATVAEHDSFKLPNNTAAMLIKMDAEGDVEGLAESLAQHIDGLIHDGTRVSATAATRDSANVRLETEHGSNQTVDRILGLGKGDKLTIAGRMITVVNCAMGSVRIYYSFEPVLDLVGLSTGGFRSETAPRERKPVTAPAHLDLVREILKGLAAAIRKHLETSVQAKPVLTDVRL